MESGAEPHEVVQIGTVILIQLAVTARALEACIQAGCTGFFSTKENLMLEVYSPGNPPEPPLGVPAPARADAPVGLHLELDPTFLSALITRPQDLLPDGQPPSTLDDHIE